MANGLPASGWDYASLAGLWERGELSVGAIFKTRDRLTLGLAVLFVRQSRAGQLPMTAHCSADEMIERL
ncbi:hypothetical protein SKAU_G00356950 [Synaphobranchus kaupii]|uniref:Uncharacterized protein n=1 Tax=Synaphobranchus kaupii TaxID=118154 RepID=A0A9Q1IGP9_SYNKA|nr:hypothetical protein SKAU_G00356950 [Synaphobranchus kaupii]